MFCSMWDLSSPNRGPSSLCPLHQKHKVLTSEPPGKNPTLISLFSHLFYQFQFSSVAQSCPTLCDPMNCSTPDLPVHHQLPEFTQTPSIESVMSSSHLILCCPLLPLPSIFPSIRVFSKESTICIRWPKSWRFSISPSNEYSGLIKVKWVHYS